jgi:DNA mismatch repair protein MutL
VEHLFANVPARRKFLRTPQTEYRHALRVVTEAALCRLEVAFRLQHEGREIFRLPKGQGLRERALAVFGRRMLEGAVTVAIQADDLRLTGVLGSPASARRTAGGVHLFVNGRPIAHRGLSYALYSGYGELVPDGSYPFACLFLELPARQVDVNVHPAKREVRFADEPRVKDFVIGGVREALGRELGSRPFEGGRGQAGSAGGGVQTGSRSAERHDLPWHDHGLFSGDSEAARTAAAALFSVQPPETVREGPVPEEARIAEPMIWQVHDRYLISPIRSGVLVVDQHAAHERVLYEDLLSQLMGSPATSQQLLFPLVMDISADQYALVEELGPLLERVGFVVRPFGGNTVALEAVPPSVERAGREEEVLLALLDDLSERGARGSGVQEKIAASLACHAAIRFGDRLDPEERRALVDQLFACERPQVCPHGRPTHLVLSLDELDRRFER